MQLARLSILAALALSPCAVQTYAQTAPDAKSAQEAKPAAEDKTAEEAKHIAERRARQDLELPQVLQTFYLPWGATQYELNDTQTAMRNVLNSAKIYALPNDNKIVVAGTPAEIALAQKLFDSLDFSKKLYRLTYTINEFDSSKKIGEQHFSVVVASGGKTEMKQVSKVPIMVGNTTDKGGDIQYEDVGLSITASVDGYSDSVRLRSKVEESTIAEEKTVVSNNTGNPVIRETSLEGSAILVQGKPLLLGSLDTPGSTRHQEVEVVSELVR